MNENPILFIIRRRKDKIHVTIIKTDPGDQILDAEERKNRGKRAVSVAISGNILLTILNFVVGTLSGSLALIAESSHTLSDVLTSIITSIGFRIGMIPPDSEHPYGHGRAEPLAGLIIVVFLGIVAFEIFSEVYRKLVFGGALNPPDMTAAVMALVGVGINLTMATYMRRTGERIKSPAIIADAQHQKVDIFSCIAIFIGVVGSRLGIPVLDLIIAIFISIMVLKTAFDIARENINNIMGKVPSHEILVDIKRIALSVEGVLGIHDIKINYIGPYASADLDVEVKADLSLKEAHKISHDIERRIIEGVEIVKMVNVHVCPTGEDEKFCVESVDKTS